MKILLIVPNWKWCEEEKNVNYPYPPYNLCLLAAILREKKITNKIKILDADVENLTIDDVEKKIIEFNPDIVGTTVLMDQLSAVGHQITKIAKKVDPKIVTILGGVYATMNPKQAIIDKDLDYVIVGEGEYVFPELVQYLKGDKSELPKKGLMYKNNDGKISFNSRADFVEEMDELPFPAWDLINFHAYSKHVAREFSPDSPRDLPYIRLYTSRGCPFTCSFCQVPKIAGHKVRRQSAKKVVDELEMITKKFGIKSFMNSDDNFLATSRDNIKDFLVELTERKLGLTWIFEDVGVMHLTKEKIDWLAASGCKYMGFAMETGVMRISKEIIAGKPLKKEHAKTMLEYAKSKGIFCAASFIIGFPSETWEEIRETIKFAQEFDADYTRIHILVPLKNTKIYEIVEKEGLFNNRYEHFNQTATWRAGQIETSREYTSNDLTVLKAMEWDRINFTNPAKRKKICEWLRVTEEEMLQRRRQTIESIYNNIRKDTERRNANPSGAFAATFERVDASLAK